PISHVQIARSAHTSAAVQLSREWIVVVDEHQCCVVGGVGTGEVVKYLMAVIENVACRGPGAELFGETLDAGVEVLASSFDQPVGVEGDQVAGLQRYRVAREGSAREAGSERGPV